MKHGLPRGRRPRPSPLGGLPADSSREVGRIITLFNAGRHAEAEKDAAALLGRHPRAAALWAMKARTLSARGKHAAALRDLRRGLALKPGDRPLRLQAAEALAALGRIESAAALAPWDPGLRLRLAVRYKDARNYRAAAAECRAALRLDPSSLEGRELESALAALKDGPGSASSEREPGARREDLVLTRRAAAALARGERAAARRLAERALGVFPQSAAALEFTARLDWEEGRFGGGWDAITRAVRAAPREPGLRLKAAQFLVKLARPHEALREISAAIRFGLDPEVGAAAKAELESSLGWSRRALASLRPALQAGAGPDRLVKAARLLEDLGRFREAQACLERAVRADPSHGPALGGLARILLWRADARRSLALSDRWARRGGGAPARRLRAGARILLGEPRAALGDLDGVLRGDPRDAEAYVWRAEARRLLKDYPGCRSDAERACGLWVLPVAALVNKALAAYESGGAPAPAEASLLAGLLRGGPWGPVRRAAGSAEGLRRVLRALGGNRTTAMTVLRGGTPGAALLKFQPNAGKASLVALQGAVPEQGFDRVLSRFNRLLKRLPEDAQVFAHRGEVRLWSGDAKGARSDFRTALRLDPMLRWPRVGLVGAELLLGRTRESLKWAGEAVARGASERVLWPWRGELFLRLGRTEEAIRDLSRAADGPSPRPSAWLALALAQGRAGRPGEQRRIFLELKDWAYGLMFDGAQAAGMDLDRRRTWTAAEITQVLEAALRTLRGNRSSWMHAYRGPEGGLRLLQLPREALAAGAALRKLR